MKLNLKTVSDELRIDSLEISKIKKETAVLKKRLSKLVKGDVFVGGSLAKDTIVKSDEYDIDIFLRFDNPEKESKNLGEKLRKIKGFSINKVHGSRDYYQLRRKNSNLVFEIIPVKKIRKPTEAENVTDLSYFHVNYIKKKLKKNMANEVLLAKRFCKSSRVYGAESYIRGFSGYALECLIVYYKSFNKMLRALSKIKKGDKLIIDIEKQYKNKKETIINMNESRTQGPIVLVDPTWVERNVLAALSYDSLHKFQKRAVKFLRNPKTDFFDVKEIDSKRVKGNAKRNKAEYIEVKLKTDRQEGDIAGTKLKRFSEFFIKEMKKNLEIKDSEFYYDGLKGGILYLSAKPKKTLEVSGPPNHMKKEVKNFKKKHKNTYKKAGRVFSKHKFNISGKNFVVHWKKKYFDKVLSMGIVSLDVK